MAGWTGDETPKITRGCCPTLRSGQGGEGVGFADGVRPDKLTITEWERLQGFPDGYTAIEYKGKPASDATRRRAIGNSFPPPIVRWIGQRIDYLEHTPT
jgi:DNA (cytosine-5)-methyltransferase 1